MPREVRELQALVRRLDALLGMQTDERNRAQAGALTPAVEQSIATVLAHLEEQIGTVRDQIRRHMDQHPGLRSQRDLLTSIPGIGETTAALLLGELFTRTFESARQAAAFAGVVPRVHDSGTWQGRRTLSKMGSGRLAQGPLLSGARGAPT